MTWGEAVRLAQKLRADPSSQIAASLEGWDYPLTRGEILDLDTFDLLHQAHAKKTPKPHPMRPGQKKEQAKRRGNRAGRSNEQVLALVRPAS